MKKKDLFQIGEVSRLFHISVGILRHYEKIGLLIPEYVDPQTGYRYYSTRQFECLNTIRYLRALDMPLPKIADFIDNRDVNQIKRLLIEQKNEVERKRSELELVERKIINRLNQINTALSTTTDVVSIKTLPPRRLALLKKQIVPQNYLDLETSIRELEHNETSSVTFLGKVGIGLSAASLENRVFRPYEYVFIVLDEEDDYQGEYMLIPEEQCAVISFRGIHDHAEAYYGKLLDYITANGYTISGFSKEITIIDNGMTSDSSQFITEIQIPVVRNI